MVCHVVWHLSTSQRSLFPPLSGRTVCFLLDRN
jgi:hypothetical protein